MKKLKIKDDKVNKHWLITIIEDPIDGDQGIGIPKNPNKSLTIEEFEAEFLQTLTEQDEMDIEYINMEFNDNVIHTDPDVEKEIDKDRKQRRKDLIKRLTEKVYL